MPIFYMDPLSGNDSTTTTPLGWWSIAFTGGTAPAPVGDEVVTGATSGSTAKVTVIGTLSGGSWAGGDAAGTMYFYGKSAAFQSEQVNFAGGGHMHIAADFTYCAWKTITSGALAARIAPGDTIRIQKSPAPTSLGNATWTNESFSAQTIPTKAIVSSTNATPIQITANSHGYVTGDIIFITGHTTNTNANGLWIITYVGVNTFTLDGSVGNGVGGATGTCQNSTGKVVKLATADITKTIDNCDVLWTTVDAAKCVCSVATTIWKEGYGSQKFAITAAAGVEKIAYHTITSTNFSGYQQISFWVYSSVVLAAADFQLCLCSDTTGDTIVDTINIPAITTINKWNVVTIDKGSALGNPIQSIALYQAVDKGALDIYIDNVIACKDDASADSLSLTSLISKNSLAQGGDEGWYGIQSIKDTLVVLDSYIACTAAAGRGYSTGGTSPETCTTYKREPFRANGSNTLQEAGTAIAYTTYDGGYDKTTNSQDGETYLDGGDGVGSGISAASYTRINHISVTRYNIGIGSSATLFVADNVQSALNCTYGINPSACIYNIFNVKHAGQCAIGIATGQNSHYNKFGPMTINGTLDYTNSVSGAIQLTRDSDGNVFEGVTARNNACYAVIFDPTYITGDKENVVKNLISSGNWRGICNTHRNYFINPVIAETTDVVASSYSVCYVQQMDGTPGNHWVYFSGATINLQTGTMYGTIGAWKYDITSTSRMQYYTVSMPLVRIQVTANKLVTVKCWIKKTTSSDLVARLICRSNQVAGITTDQTATKLDNTNWEEVSLTFTPTADGIVTIEGEAYCVGSVSSCYFDSEMTVTIAP
jgi:hypothetical protein